MFHTQPDRPKPVGLAPFDAEGTLLAGLERETSPGFEPGRDSPMRSRRFFHLILPSHVARSIAQAPVGRGAASPERRSPALGGALPRSERDDSPRAFPAVGKMERARGPSAETITPRRGRSARQGHFMSSPFRAWGVHSNLPLSPAATDTRRHTSLRRMQGETGDPMPEMRELTSGLRFPEGPVVLPDGSILVVEIAGGVLTRVAKDGRKTVVAKPGGGPNGAAMGPDGKIYVTNNGGSFSWHTVGGLTVPGPTPPDHRSGRIERIDIETGKVEVIYDSCDGRSLRGPNDLVFDSTGGFWFTDHGTTQERSKDRTGVFYAKADGSSIREVIFPLDSPNGVGLSPDQRRVYVAETHTGRVWAWAVPTPGAIAQAPGFGPSGGTLLVGLPGFQLFDSLAVDGEGWVCVATLVNGGITAVSPDGSRVEHIPTGDPLTTNICFGGKGLRTAYLTLSGTGRLVSTEWPRPGLKLAY